MEKIKDFNWSARWDGDREKIDSKLISKELTEGQGELITFEAYETYLRHKYDEDESKKLMEILLNFASLMTVRPTRRDMLFIVAAYNIGMLDGIHSENPRMAIETEYKINKALGL